MTITSQELQVLLSNHYGTSNHFRHSFTKMLYTDGVKAFAENAEAYWFLDIISTEVLQKQSVEEFINVVLKVSEKLSAVITADDGNGNVFWTKRVPYTDCPEGDWKFYLVNGVLILPSEN